MSIRLLVVAMLAVSALAATTTAPATTVAATTAAATTVAATTAAATTVAATTAAATTAAATTVAATTAAATTAAATTAAATTAAATTAAATTAAATTAAATTAAATTAAATTAAATTAAATTAAPSLCATAIGTLFAQPAFLGAYALFNHTNYACNSAGNFDARDCNSGLAAYTAACEGISTENTMCDYALNTTAQLSAQLGGTEFTVNAHSYQCTPAACQTAAGVAEQRATIIAYSDAAAVAGGGGAVVSAETVIFSRTCGNDPAPTTTGPDDNSPASFIACTASLLAGVVALLN